MLSIEIWILVAVNLKSSEGNPIAAEGNPLGGHDYPFTGFAYK